MAIKVKVVPKDNGDEPKVKDTQQAPIIGDDNDFPPWEEGTINEDHADLPAGPDAPAGPTGNDGPELPPAPEETSDSVPGIGTGEEASGSPSQESVPAMPDGPAGPSVADESEPVGASIGGNQEPGDGPEPAPEKVGEDAPEQASSDQQEQEPGQVETAAEETFETVNNGVVTEDVQMTSHGEVISTNHESEPVGQPITGQVARVSYACGFTKNIGEFNSLRAEVKIELPCAVENVETTYEEAVKFVDGRLQKLWNDA